MKPLEKFVALHARRYALFHEINSRQVVYDSELMRMHYRRIECIRNLVLLHGWIPVQHGKYRHGAMIAPTCITPTQVRRLSRGSNAAFWTFVRSVPCSSRFIFDGHHESATESQETSVLCDLMQQTVASVPADAAETLAELDTLWQRHEEIQKLLRESLRDLEFQLKLFDRRRAKCVERLIERHGWRFVRTGPYGQGVVFAPDVPQVTVARLSQKRNRYKFAELAQELPTGTCIVVSWLDPCDIDSDSVFHISPEWFH